MRLHHVVADLLRVPQQPFFLDHIERGQRRRNADRIPAESRRMRTRNPVHDLGLAHGDAERHSGGNALRHANDVGMHAGVFDGKPFAGAANAALHFVHHQQNAVLVADAAQFLHEDRRSDDVPAFALDRLDKNRRHFFRREHGLKQFVFDVAGAAEREFLRILRTARAAAIHIGISARA